MSIFADTVVYALGTTQEPPWKTDLPASPRILQDGSVDPPEASVNRIGDIYKLTGDVDSTIIVDRDK